MIIRISRCISTTLVLTFVMALGACDRKIEQISDSDLTKKRNECRNMRDPAPAMIFACDNYARECKRRREVQGRFVC